MHIIDYIIFALYMIGVLGVGIYCCLLPTRWVTYKQTKGTDT